MLVGRSGETAALDDLLADARAGRSRVLVLRGEAGIGKSALLEYARARADGLTVLQAVGIESESEFAFAGLHQLLRPAVERIDGLPAPQAAALRSAFALSPETVDDRFRIAVAVLGLLCSLAEDAPLLCLVDDAQWLDQPSADALLFAARRLEAESMVILFAARDGHAPFPAPGIPELRLEALEERAARELASATLDGADAERLEWLVASARGNPLALIELAAAGAGDGAAAPTTSVEAAYLKRIEELPAAAARILLIAAAEDTGDRAVIERAAAAVGLDPVALAAAEEAGLVRVGTELIEFRHPLVRSAAYRGAGFVEREQAHRALAEALTSPGDADRRAWHRAAATVGPDEDVAAELEESASRARLRGGHAAAVAALVRAADLSADDAAACRRLLLAAAASNLAGRYLRTIALTERALGLSPDPVVAADLALLRAGAELWHGRPADVSVYLSEAGEAVAAHDAARALRIATAAAEAGAVACSLDCMVRASRVADLVTPNPDDEQEVLLWIMPRAGAAFYGGELDRSAELFREVTRLSIATDDPQDYVWRGVAALLSGEAEQALALFSAGAVRARELGAAGALLHVLSRQALCAFYFADVRRAVGAAHEVVKLGSDLGAPEYATHAVGVLAWAAALAGDEVEHQRHARLVEQERHRGAAIPPAAVSWGRAELALARGRWNEALEDLVPISESGPGFSHPLIALASAPSLAEAARRVGRPELAEKARATIEPWIGNTSPGHALPLLERTLALEAEGTEAEAHFEEALRLLEGEINEYHRARTELLYGEHLRRERKRSEAREHLRAALRGFERLGAAPWVERTAGELRATGETARRRDPSTLGQLTPQEQQIARLVAEGASNKDVAAQLFLSPRTVEYHLRKVFQKLGIASRAELIRHDVRSEAAGAPV